MERAIPCLPAALRLAEAFALLDLAPGGVCPAGSIAATAGGLLHHRFTLTSQITPAGNTPLCCTCRQFTRPAVSRHRALWSADFPQLRTSETAITRPTWPLDRNIYRPTLASLINQIDWA